MMKKIRKAMKKRNSSGSYSKQAISTKNKIIGVLVLCIIAGGVTFGLGWHYGWFAPISFTTTTTGETSTIDLISRVDGEDVSGSVDVDIWIPKSTAEFNDQEDVLTLSNYELLGTTKAADLISIDFTPYDYIFVEIDPDGASVFSNDFYLLTGGVNYAYTLYVYHLASDVNFNMVDSTTMDEVSVSGYQTDGNYTILFDVPHHTTTNIHANDDPNWAVTEDDWADMSTADKEYYWDEANFRCEATLYDPTVASDASKQNYNLKFSDITSTFAFKLTFNDTIGSSTSVTGMNVTIDDSKVSGNVYRIDDGDDMYLAFDSTILFTSGVQQLGLELEFGANITLSSAYSGRLTIPSHFYDKTDLAFSALSAIGA